MTGVRHLFAVTLVATALAACSGATDDVSPAADDAAPAGTASTGAGSDPTAPAGDPASSETPGEPTTSAPQPERPATTAESPATESSWADGAAETLFGAEEVLDFALTLSEQDLAFLDADPAAEEYVEGAMSFGGDVVSPVGIRYKGSVGAFLGCVDGPNPFEPSGPKTCPKLSMKIKVNWEDSKTEFFGQRRLQFHSMNRDASMMREALGYRLFADIGVPSPRTAPMRLSVNGEDAGLFLLVENIDGRFTRDRFADGTGNLYKEAWPFTETGEVTDEAELIDSLRTNEDEDPTAEAMRSFAGDLLDAAGDPIATRAVLDRWTDVEELLAHFVVDRAILHDDGPLHWYCLRGECAPHNFFWYEEPTAARLHLLPWDLDNAFQPDDSPARVIIEIADGWGEVSNDCQPFPHGPLSIPQRSAACDPLVAALSSLDTEFRRIQDRFFADIYAPDRIASLLDGWSEQLAPHVEEQAEVVPGAPTPAEWENAVAGLLAFVAEREKV